jgi:hypothetical protein
MTQYPNPYNLPPQQQMPAGYGYYMQPDPLAPAKRASILMFIVGGLFLLCGACMAGVSYVPMDQLAPEQAVQFSQLESQIRGQTGFGLMQLVFGMGLVLLIPGLLYLVLGFLVRGGGLGSVITSIVITSLVLLLMVVQLVTGIAQVARDPTNSLGLCFVFVPLILVSLLMYFLIGAVRAAPQVRSMRDQQAAQYWQYQQNQQQYGQPGYGYTQPSPMPPPPPPPPPASDADRAP